MDCLIILLATLLTPVLSYPFGAGPSACKTLVPGHGKEPQPASTLPFLIEPDADHFVVNRVLKVRIRTVHGKYKNRKISGFFVQARAPDGSEAVGQWIVEGEEAGKVAHIKTRDCFHPADSITHADPKPKSVDIVLHFLPTGNMPEHIQFMGTIARDFAHYWTNVRSSIIGRRFVAEPELPPPTPPTTHTPKRIHHVTHNIVHHATSPLVHHHHKVSHVPRRSTTHRTTTTTTTLPPVTTVDLVVLQEMEKYAEEKRLLEEKERNSLLEKSKGGHPDNEENVQNDGSNPDSQAAKIRNGSNPKTMINGVNAGSVLCIARPMLLLPFVLLFSIWLFVRL